MGLTPLHPNPGDTTTQPRAGSDEHDLCAVFDCLKGRSDGCARPGLSPVDSQFLFGELGADERIVPL